MENQPSSSYDLFISSRGEDDRDGLTDHLYKALTERGINTFIDDKENEITPSLVKVIQQCRIAIIIFTKNYASSSFCLEELSSIVDNFQQNHENRFIFPFFYNIDPSHVRNQSGPYQTAFSNHEERLKENKEKVVKWRNALSQVAGLTSGWHFETGDGNEFELIGKIVEEVSSKFDDVPPLHTADYTVGLDSRLGELYEHLELESHEVLMVGIYGIGGIGKTTLARAVYKRIADQFEAKCFLSNVREDSTRHGLVHLQEMLLLKMTGLKDIQLGDASEGISVIKQRLHQKKVLLILDDVDTLEQLEALAGGLDSFGSGSRVLITTRDKSLLVFRVERRYEVKELNHVDALKLLSRKAFKQGIVDPVYTELLNRVATYISGLPLVLEVIGSSLFGKSVDQWRNTLDQLERIPQSDIQKILRISFDALDEEEKSIFLDICCFFNGHKLAYVKEILGAHYGHDQKYHIEHLIDISLINISLDGKVTLHGLVESMGKEFVRTELPKDPGRHSRSRIPEDIIQVLNNMISHRDFQAERTWRLVGLMSSVVGLSCYALSPSFNRLIGKWKAFKFILYGGLSLAILTTIFLAKQSSLSTRQDHLKTYTSFLVLMIISVYSFFYDRAVNGKPEILEYSFKRCVCFGVIKLAQTD